jgi:hypothetical protein
MRRPSGFGLVALVLAGMAGCAGTTPRLSWSWASPKPADFADASSTSLLSQSREASSREEASQTAASYANGTAAASRGRSTTEPVSIWPEPRSSWLSSPFPVISRLWNGTGDASGRSRAGTDPGDRPTTTDAGRLAPRTKPRVNSRSAQTDDDVRTVDATAAFDASSQERDQGTSDVGRGNLRAARRARNASKNVRNSDADGESDALDADAPNDPHDLPPAGRLRHEAGSPTRDGEESLLPPGSLSALESRARNARFGSQPVGGAATETTGTRLRARRPATARDDEAALRRSESEPLEPRVLASAPELDSAWDHDEDPARQPSAAQPVPAAVGSDPERGESSPTPLRAAPATEPAVAEPKFEPTPAPAVSASVPSPVGSATASAPDSASASPLPSPAATPSPATVVIASPATPTTGDESHSLPAPTPTAPREPAGAGAAPDLAAGATPTPSQSPTSAASATIVSLSLPAQAAPPPTKAVPQPGPKTQFSPAASPQSLYASPPPTAPGRSRGWLSSWLFPDGAAETIPSAAFPPPVFPSTYRLKTQCEQAVQPSSQQAAHPAAATPVAAKKQCFVLRWIHMIKGYGQGSGSAGNHGCGRSGCCACCPCCGKNAAATPSALACGRPASEARTAASDSPHSGQPQPDDVAQRRKVVDTTESKDLDETPKT